MAWQDPPWRLVAEPGLAAELDYTQLPDLAQVDPAQTVDPYVKLAQALLNAAGTSPALEVDGLFGPATNMAVVWSQVRALLPPTGVVDADTWLALAASGQRPRLEPGPDGPPMAGPPIALLQRLLNEAGAYPYLVVDGSFDTLTVDRLREFQLSRGLYQSGVVDADTWYALGNVHVDEGPIAYFRLVYEYDGSWWANPEQPTVRLARIEEFDAAAPLSDPLESDDALAGAWVEVWDEYDRPLYRRFLHDPFGLSLELRPGEGEVDERRVNPNPAGEFEVVIPYQARSWAVAVFSSPLNAALAGQPASVIQVDRL
jgi:peptidoglycan hydrolase-like protein with peptidoglycan-binding domain